MALAAGVLAAIPIAASGATGDVSRQGFLPTGVPAATDVEGAAFSAEGRHLLITSTAPLSGVPTGGFRQLFVRDLVTGRARMASASATGEAADAAVDDDAGARTYGVSGDGRFVVFSSTARNLVADDENGSARDVFRKDMRTGRIIIVSRDHRGAQPEDGVTGQPSMSADGSRVAFTSATASLTPADRNSARDVYLADLRARSLVLISRTRSGEQSPGATDHPSISADGRSVAFQGTAAASVLAADDLDGHGDVYVARPASRTIEVASLPAGGTDDGTSTLPSLSGNGSLVAFASTSRLVPGDPTAAADAYVRDTAAGTTRRASDQDISGGPVISTNGTRVAFTGTTDVHVRTLATDGLYRASRTAGGGTPAPPSTRAAISGTGGLASFTNSDDPSGPADVFVTDLDPVPASVPGITARATSVGQRVTVAGHASDPAGITDVTVGGRTARVADDGAYAVSFIARVGIAEVTVRVTTGVGTTGATTVVVTRDPRSRGVATVALRPRDLTATVVRPWVRASFVLPVAAAWRIELRQRVPGATGAASFRMLAHRSGPPSTGARITRLRLPAGTAPGPYQVRVLTSSALGLGTTARTITVP